MKIALLVLSMIFIVSALATISKREEWWIRAFDFPYVHFTALGLLNVVGWVLLHFPTSAFEIAIASMTFILLVYRITVIYPYTRLKKPTIPWSEGDVSSIRLVSGNVLMYNDDHDSCLKVISESNPDILLLVEVSEEWERALTKELAEKYPYRILKALNNTYGMVLYSKLVLKDTSIAFLVEEVPSFHATIVLPHGQSIRFYGLHPKPPAPGQNDSSVPRDAELVKVGKMARESDLPVIVAGDMNDVAWSHTTRLFMRVSGLLDPRMGRGFFNTFDARKPLLRWPLDHFFLSHHFKIAKLERLNSFHSDHFPIQIDVALDPSSESLAAKEHASEEDLEEAQEKLQEANAG